MSSSSAALSTEFGNINHQDTIGPDTNLPKKGGPMDHEEDEEEDEDEDVDFNPFLKETPSLESSSSLSSEIEGLDADVAESEGNTNAISLLNLPDSVQDYPVVDSEHGEEIVMKTTISSRGKCRNILEKTSLTSAKETKSVLISQPNNEASFGLENDSSSGTQVINDVVIGESSSNAHSGKPVVNFDDEDSICMRTRARYSLASFTLDELETFLQGTDDDDDLQNIDDEEEYRKFLAAVLQGGDGDCQSTQGNVNIDDEDEDNDADFELEIEEALESDLDENIRDETQEQVHEAVVHRPKTRQSRRQKASVQQKKKLSGQLNRPLRPLLPIAPLATPDGKFFMPQNALHCVPSSENDGFINGFTPYQIGQLHCLIHEHVQLLIQVFSLCALEPARQHIASEVQGLIAEMLHKRNQILAWRRVPYPSFYFCPPYVRPSVPDEHPKILPTQCTFEPLSTFDAQRNCPSGSNVVPHSNSISPSKGRYEYSTNGSVGYFQSTEGSSWMPYISGPILSVLDVAPLNLAGSYINDVSTAMLEYRRHVGVTSDTRFEREPLFPLHSLQSFAETSSQSSRGTISPGSRMVLPPSATNQMPRKTMAATLVERAKNQSVAPVPKGIAKLAQRFLPLFNPALYPHKPPPAPVTNRVLFTDAEDELLALGLMEYNTDWKAIQQRFLPCKSKNQIFVRQKNRSSSKAPENPIKAVRRMKNSPLTAEEKARIEEGLKVFKLDWMSVWKFIVPYRDSSLLPRQWRIATGTQKSYKLDADKKAKRRLYDSKRRKCKIEALASTSSEKEDYNTDNAGGENKSIDDCTDKEDEAYVHEAFLADWRPSATTVSSKHPVLDRGEQNRPTHIQSQENSHVMERMNNSGPGNRQTQIGQEFPAALRSSNSQICWRPYRARRANNARVVKLAPDLPPVNLPPSVRVISQSAFKSYHGGANASICGPATENVVSKPVVVAKSGTYPIKSGQDRSNQVTQGTTNLQDFGAIGNNSVAEEKGESDLQMHPLLFRAPEDGSLPYYPLNCSASTSSPFNIFSGNQTQLNLSLFHNPHLANQTVFFNESLKSKEKTSAPFGIDFHPLLQRTDDCVLVAAPSTSKLPANSESSMGVCAQLQNPYDASQTKSRVNRSPITTYATPCSSNRKSNELDLEIHLSFTSGKGNELEGRDTTEHKTVGSTVKTKKSLEQCTEYMPSSSTPECISNKFDSGAHAFAISSNGRNRNSANDIGDQSLPEIVMEQEELSDSEEEIGENVEFECEEMTDSEGEDGSDPEQIVDIQNKEVPNVATEKVGIVADFDNQQCEPSGHGNSDGNDRDPSEGSNKPGLADKGLSSSLCLNLNSCPPASPSTKPKSGAFTHPRNSVGQKRASARSNRSCKNEKHDAVQKNPGSNAVAPLRKPRKRACKNGSIMGGEKQIDSNLNTDVNVESCNFVNNDEFG